MLCFAPNSRLRSPHRSAASPHSHSCTVPIPLLDCKLLESSRCLRLSSKRPKQGPRRPFPDNCKTWTGHQGSEGQAPLQMLEILRVWIDKTKMVDRTEKWRMICRSCESASPWASRSERQIVTIKRMKKRLTFRPQRKMGKSVARVQQVELKAGAPLIYHLNWDSSEKGYCE